MEEVKIEEKVQEAPAGAEVIQPVIHSQSPDIIKLAHKNKEMFLGAIVLLCIAWGILWSILGAPEWRAQSERIVIAQGMTEEAIVTKLKTEGFIRSEKGLNFVLSVKGWHGKIKAGGYRISKSMNAWHIGSILAGEPYMRWVTIPEGLRKEEIAEEFTDVLGWTEQDAQGFVNASQLVGMPLSDGYYFPDTYLVAIDEGGEKVAERMYARFNEKFADYAQMALGANIKHTTVVKMASIIEREAAGKSDMPLIAGVLWNRLDRNMKLDIDATIQYAKGRCDKGWWCVIKPEDKAIDSKYNTYKYSGLPVGAISNPGIAAIEAVLKPAKTKCLYYLHDKSKQIHCAQTYEEHKKNIAKYLQ